MTQKINENKLTVVFGLLGDKREVPILWDNFNVPVKNIVIYPECGKTPFQIHKFVESTIKTFKEGIREGNVILTLNENISFSFNYFILSDYISKDDVEVFELNKEGELIPIEVNDFGFSIPEDYEKYMDFIFEERVKLMENKVKSC